MEELEQYLHYVVLPYQVLNKYQDYTVNEKCRTHKGISQFNNEDGNINNKQ